MRTFKEWRDGYNPNKRPFPPMLYEDYEVAEDDIFHFWYLCNEDSPRVLKFIAGLDDLMDRCFPETKIEEQTLKSHLNPHFIHRHIRITEDA